MHISIFMDIGFALEGERKREEGEGRRRGPL